MEEVRLSGPRELSRTFDRSPPQGAARADKRPHEVADTR
jgi:hypothetical protein